MVREDAPWLTCFAARPQDQIDVEGILIRQQGRLDWPYIYENLQPLAEVKEAPELIANLRALEMKWRQP